MQNVNNEVCANTLPVDSQLTEPKSFVRQIVSAAIAVSVALLIYLAIYYFHDLSNPYLKSVLALNGDPANGKQIFQINCSGCHGKEGKGIVGPSLQDISHRRSNISLIHQVIDGKTPPMPKFQPEPETMADLLSYLESL